MLELSMINLNCMNYIFIALVSYFLNSIAITVDKFLISKTIPDPLIYVFYFCLVGFFVSFGIPFTHFPGTEIFFLGSISTVVWTLGAYFMFVALKTGQVQRVIPIIGTITPLTLLILASQTNSITQKQGLAIVVLILGLVFLTFKDWKGKFIWTELLLEIASGVLFAFSYHFLRLAFLQDDFFTVLVWSKLVLIPLGIMFLIIPRLRVKILPVLKPTGGVSKMAPLFAFGQTCAGISELLLTYSISLASPALINALQGVKYVYLLIFSLILGRKFPQIFQIRMSKGFLLTQIIGIGFIGIGLYLLVLV